MEPVRLLIKTEAVALRVAVFRIVAVVEARTQLLARLEEGHVLAFHRDRIAGARVAAGARFSLANRESAEAAKLDTIPTLESSGDLVEDDIDDLLYLTHFQRGVLLGQSGDEFRTEHEPKIA